MFIYIINMYMYILIYFWKIIVIHDYKPLIYKIAVIDVRTVIFIFWNILSIIIAHMIVRSFRHLGIIQNCLVFSSYSTLVRVFASKELRDIYCLNNSHASKFGTEGGSAKNHWFPQMIAWLFLPFQLITLPILTG